jgi:anti-anti-sigma regulatory factor
LLGSFEGVDKVLLELKDLEGADLSTLQVLCSAHRTSEKLNKDLVVENQCLETLQKLMEESGFSRQTGCFPGNNKSCFWTKGGM